MRLSGTLLLPLLATLALPVPPAAAEDETTAAAAGPQTPAAADDADLPGDPRLEVYERFLDAFKAGHYAEALPLAQEVVRLTEFDENRAHELPTAWSNLGTTQLKLGDLAAAEASYQKALDLVEINYGIASRRLILPLAGLGNVASARQDHATAIDYFRRAIAVSRRAEGLFNLGQLDLVEPLIASYAASEDLASVQRERMYALQVAEQNFGPRDQRTLPAVANLAVLYESMALYPYARAMYARMRDIGLQEGGTSNEILITALLGIGRSHRLQYVVDPESLLAPAETVDPITGKPVPQIFIEPFQAPRPDRDGRRAIEEAIELLRAADDPPPRLLGSALVEMGDWYLTLGRAESAVSQYAEAWRLFHEALPQEQNPLSAPRRIFYRAPTASKRGPNALPGKVVNRFARFLFEVDATGMTRNIVVDATDMTDAQLSQTRRALDRALFSPRFEDGQAVATPSVEFVGYWEELETPPGSSSDPGVTAAGG